MKHKKYQRILVKWEDHHSANDETDPHEVNTCRAVIWETSGWLVKETDAAIQVARDVCYDPDFNPCDAVVTILKKCILKRSDHKKAPEA